jgi:DNA polymerase III sliding clamp (beta) subunit (PCNA family)
LAKLLESLAKVKEATAKQDLLPILKCFCFTGKTVFAYDDKMAVETECDIGIRGAVPADQFYNFVKTFPEDKISFDQKDETTFVIKSGKSRIELTGRNEDSFIFEMPDSGSDYFDHHIEIDEEFVKGLRMCMSSVSTTYMLPVFAGITVEIDKGICYMHSCCVESISRYEFPIESTDYPKFILDGKFCKSLISNCAEQKATLLLAEDAAMVEASDCKMYVKLPSEIEHDIRDRFEQISANADENDMFPIPDMLEDVLGRSILASGKEGTVKLSTSSGTMTVVTSPENNKALSSNIEEVVEIEYEGSAREALLNPNALKSVITDECKEISVGEDEILIKGGSYSALVSTFSE